MMMNAPSSARFPAPSTRTATPANLSTARDHLRAPDSHDRQSASRAPNKESSTTFPEYQSMRKPPTPKTQADLDKLSQSLERLSQEDPSFKVSMDPETGQTLISGMGELHLEIITDRLLREVKVEANVGRPQVAYRETVSRTALVEARYNK